LDRIRKLVEKFETVATNLQSELAGAIAWNVAGGGEPELAMVR